MPGTHVALTSSEASRLSLSGGAHGVRPAWVQSPYHGLDPISAY